MDETISTPKISVVMSVLNGEKYLRESIQSILDQTYSDFEFIIVNDGSTDKTAEILNDYASKDARFRILSNLQNMGVGYSRNIGNAAARGKYIAIMDSDDQSHPERFARQVQFLDENPDIAVLGTSYVKSRSDGFTKLLKRYNLPGLARWHLVFYCALNNPSVMMRRTLVSEEGFTYAQGIEGEDFEFFSKVSRNHKITNIEEPLHTYRWHEGNLTVVKASTFVYYNNLTIHEQIKYYTGIEIPEELIQGFKHPQDITKLSEARSIIGIILLLLKSTEKWDLDVKESAAIMIDFLRILKTAAKSVKKHPILLIKLDEWGIFLIHYVKFRWNSFLENHQKNRNLHSHDFNLFY